MYDILEYVFVGILVWLIAVITILVIEIHDTIKLIEKREKEAIQ